jgi:hypothetical protein
LSAGETIRTTKCYRDRIRKLNRVPTRGNARIFYGEKLRNLECSDRTSRYERTPLYDQGGRLPAIGGLESINGIVLEKAVHKQSDLPVNVRRLLARLEHTPAEDHRKIGFPNIDARFKPSEIGPSHLYPAVGLERAPGESPSPNKVQRFVKHDRRAARRIILGIRESTSLDDKELLKVALDNTVVRGNVGKREVNERRN